MRGAWLGSSHAIGPPGTRASVSWVGADAVPRVAAAADCSARANAVPCAATLRKGAAVALPTATTCAQTKYTLSVVKRALIVRTFHFGACGQRVMHLGIEIKHMRAHDSIKNPTFNLVEGFDGAQACEGRHRMMISMLTRDCVTKSATGGFTRRCVCIV